MAEPPIPFKVKATYDYASEFDDDLSFTTGTIITVTAVEDDEWYSGEANGNQGMFPKNFVEIIADEPAVPKRPVSMAIDPEPKLEAKETKPAGYVPMPGAAPKADPYAVKKQFIAPAKSSYVPKITPRDDYTPHARHDVAHNDSEIVKSTTVAEEQEEEGPKMSLKERIALLQKKQQEEVERAEAAAKRAEEKKRKQEEDRRHREEVRAAAAHDDANVDTTVQANEFDPQSTGHSLGHQSTGHSLGHQSTGHSLGRQSTGHSIRSISRTATGVSLEGATKSADDEAEDDEDDDELAPPVPHGVPIIPGMPAPASSSLAAPEPEQNDAEEEDEEDEDLKRRRLVERMAKISGGRNMFGMMGMPSPFGGAASQSAPSKKDADLTGGNADDEYDPKSTDAAVEEMEQSVSPPMSPNNPPSRRASKKSLSSVNSLRIMDNKPVEVAEPGYEADEDLSDLARTTEQWRKEDAAAASLAGKRRSIESVRSSESNTSTKAPPPPPPGSHPVVVSPVAAPPPPFAPTAPPAAPAVPRSAPTPTPSYTVPSIPTGHAPVTTPPSVPPSAPSAPPRSVQAPPVPEYSVPPPVPGAPQVGSPKVPPPVPGVPPSVPAVRSASRVEDFESDSDASLAENEFSFDAREPARAKTESSLSSIPPPVPAGLPPLVDKSLERSRTDASSMSLASTSTKGPSSPTKGLSRSKSVRSKDQSLAEATYDELEYEIHNIGGSSPWWVQDKLPESLTPRLGVDLNYEVDTHTNVKRGGKEVVYKDYYIVFADLSQLQFEIDYDSSDPRSSVKCGVLVKVPPPIIRRDLLDKFHHKYAELVVKAAIAKVGTNSDDVVPQILEGIGNNLLEPIGDRAFGVTIYKNFNNANIAKIEEVRPGDILWIKGGAFADKKLSGHSRRGDDQSVHTAVIYEYNHDHHLIKVIESDGPLVTKQQYNINDFVSGRLRVFRPVGRDYIGWN